MFTLLRQSITAFSLFSFISAFAGQVPTLTDLAARRTVAAIQSKLNGHNWLNVDGDLKRTLPTELYKKVRDQFYSQHGLQTGYRLAHSLEHPARVESVAITGDNQFISAESDRNAVHIWDTSTGTLQLILHNHTEHASPMVISPNNQFMILGTFDGTLRVCDLASQVLTHKLEGHTGQVRAVAVSQDNRLIVSGASDCTIRLWNLQTAALINTFYGHTDCINAVALSPDNQYIISGSNDNTVRVWNATDGSLIQTLYGHTQPVRSVAISTNNQFIVSGSRDRTVRVWQLKSFEQLLEYLSESKARQQGIIGYLRFLDHKYPTLSRNGALVTAGIATAILGNCLRIQQETYTL